MIAVCFHLPEDVIEAIDNLVEQGVYANRSQAIRGLLMTSLIWHNKMLATYPVQQLQTQEDGSKHAEQRNHLLTMKINPGLLRMIDQDRRRLGFQTRSEYIRTAIIHFLRHST